MAKFCYKCGNPIKEGATFCGKCGSVVMHEPEQQSEQEQTVSSVPAVPQQPASVQPVYQQPTPHQSVYQQPAPTQQVYQQPAPVQQVYQQPTPHQPVIPVTQQLAQQAYMAQMQPRMAAPPKPLRYIPLRIILILICAALLFCGWRWGIKNVRNAMLEPSVFTASPAAEGEDIDELQAQYDEIRREAENAPDEGDTEPPFYHEVYDWLYRLPGEGGAAQ